MFWTRIEFDLQEFFYSLTFCGNPSCPKEIFSVALKNLHPKQIFSFQINIETWMPVDCTQLSSEQEKYASAFLNHFSDEEREAKKHEWLTAREGSIRLNTYVISKDVMESPQLVSYVGIVTESGGMTSGGYASTYKVIFEGIDYYVEDLYCSRPSCKCKETCLVFTNVVMLNEKEARYDTAFTVFYKFTQKFKELEADSVSAIKAKKILAKWKLEHPDALKLFKSRYKDVKKIGRRSIDGKSKATKSEHNCFNEPVDLTSYVNGGGSNVE